MAEQSSRYRSEFLTMPEPERCVCFRVITGAELADYERRARYGANHSGVRMKQVKRWGNAFGARGADVTGHFCDTFHGYKQRLADGWLHAFDITIGNHRFFLIVEVF